MVHFYGPVKGWVPKEELGLDTSGTNARPLSTLYREGQVVKCRVLQCNATSERLLLSLNVSPSRQRLKRAELIVSSAAIGSVISGVATGVYEQGVLVRIDNDTDKPLRGRIPDNRTRYYIVCHFCLRVYVQCMLIYMS